MADITEVLDKLNIAAGIRLAEISPDVSFSGKASASRVVTRYLGETVGDDVYVRTLPITAELKPREPTKVCGLNFGSVVNETWIDSSVHGVLERMVLVPVLKPDTKLAGQWRLGEAFAFVVSDSQWGEIENDFETIKAMIRVGNGDELSSAQPPRGQGRLLTAKTSGRDSADVVRYEDVYGSIHVARRRGFYLRPQLTSSLLIERAGVSEESAVFDELMAILGR